MPPTSFGLRKAGTNIDLSEVQRHYAELAKTWLTLAGDLDDIHAQL